MLDWLIPLLALCVTLLIAIIGGISKLVVIVQGWRKEVNAGVARLAHLWAQWMDETDDDITDIKNRVHDLETRNGITAKPPATRPKNRRQMQAIQAFGLNDWPGTDDPSN